MVGYDVDPDAVVALDVGHATDSPGVPSGKRGPVELGEGPIVSRGSTNHPVLVERLRAAAREEEIDVQIEATGVRTGTDADAFYTTRSGIPSVNVGIPNRYMHTPVEVVDTDDLDATVDLLAAFAAAAEAGDDFAVDV
jgi:endoglucanase